MLFCCRKIVEVDNKMKSYKLLKYDNGLDKQNQTPANYLRKQVD